MLTIVVIWLATACCIPNRTTFATLGHVVILYPAESCASTRAVLTVLMGSVDLSPGMDGCTILSGVVMGMRDTLW